MSTREFFQDKWSGESREPVNLFARRCWPLIRDRGFTGLLDLGCGLGPDSLYFARRGLAVTALDFSESCITVLKREIDRKKILNITAVEADVTALDFPAASFDVVYSHLGLHYFDDATTTRVFGRVREILRPGGLFCVKCKSTDDYLYGLGEKLGEDMYLEGHVRHFFSREYMAAKLSRFEILRLRRTASAYHGHKSNFIEAAAAKPE